MMISPWQRQSDNEGGNIDPVFLVPASSPHDSLAAQVPLEEKQEDDSCKVEVIYK